MSANSPFPFSFSLRGDFHHEVGWRDYVRDKAARDPKAIRELIAKRARFDLGLDPLTLVERWEPYTMHSMFYFWMIRKGNIAPTFVATDGALTMFLEPKPRGEHLAGLPNELMDMVHDAVAARGASFTPSPVVPYAPNNQPVSQDTYASQMVIHRFGDDVAYLRPTVPTLCAIAQDPVAWTQREPVREVQMR